MKFDYITQFLINTLKSVIQRMNERENDVQQIVRTDRTKLQSPSSIYPPVSRFREGYRRRTYRERSREREDIEVSSSDEREPVEEERRGP